MEKISQTAKEQLAIAMLKEFGCFEVAKNLAKDEHNNRLDLTAIPSESVDYLVNRFEHALRTIDKEKVE